MLGMTGYSFNEQYYDNVYIATEVKTVNHRFLEMNISVPYTLNSIEMKIRELVQKKLNRGKVDVFVTIKVTDSQNNISVDEVVAKKYFDVLQNLSNILNINEKITLSQITRYDEVFVVDKKRDYSEYWDLIEQSLTKNFDAVIKMRQIEGNSTKEDLVDLISQIEINLDRIIECIPKMEQAIFDSMKIKIVELIGTKVDESRLINEAAFMVNRSCINEEVERLKMHITHYKKVLDEESDVGKRLDFICQEMHREINTAGSKISDASVAENVIAIKNCIEKIREQIRNIE